MLQPEQPVELFYFTWRAPDRGFIWRDDLISETHFSGNREKPPYLVLHPESRQLGTPWVLPFDEPGNEQAPLFEQFARLAPTQDAIQAFANQHGWLGIGGQVHPPGPNARVQTGESLAQWRHEIGAMRLATTLWRAVDWGHEQDSPVLVRWETDRVTVTVRARRGFPFVFHRGDWPYLFPRSHRADRKSPVLAALQQLLNKKLVDMASPCVVLDRRGNLNGRVRPRHLLGALWVQLYQAILGYRRIIPCRHCGELMDVTGGRSTKQAHFRCVHRVKMNRYLRHRVQKREEGTRQRHKPRNGKRSAGRT